MEHIEILRDLFDEKIISILNELLENQDKQLSLTHISSLSKVNIATTFRIINKLIEKDIVELIHIGKSKYYKLKQGEKSNFINNLLKKDKPLTEFIDKLKHYSRIKKIIFENKTKDVAKLFIIGNSIPIKEIESLIIEIENKYNFKIQFIELNEKQYQDLEKMQLYNLGKKIIWENTATDR